MIATDTRLLRALAPVGEDAMPLGGVDRAHRIWDATPAELTDMCRLAHVKGVLRLIVYPAGMTL